jgi:hypothetical protein
LLHSWDADFGHRRFLFDVAVNIAIYIPLGVSGYLAFRRFSSRGMAVLAPVGIGTLLSASMEMVQLFTPTRQCSSIDLVDNIAGSIIGVMAGIVFVRMIDLPVWEVRDRGAIALLGCWVCYLLFPMFPLLWLGALRTKLSVFLHAPFADPIPILLNAALWFAVGRLLMAAGAWPRALWLSGFLLLLPAQIGIVSRNPMPAEWQGAAIGVAAYWLAGQSKRVDAVAGVALLAAIAMRGLTPFHFAGPPQPFLLVPFVGMLEGQWQNAVVILLSKIFQYGACIWLLQRGGFGLLRSTVAVTLVLAAIEGLQTRIPGHVAEVTDPLLASLLGLGFAALAAWSPQQPR